MAVEHRQRVGARIREARQEKGWTQGELARHLPTSVDGPTISRWERGGAEPKSETLELIAKALGQDFAYFHAATNAGGPTTQVKRTQLDRVEAKLDLLNERVALLLSVADLTDDALADAAAAAEQADALDEAPRNEDGAEPGDEAAEGT